MTQLTPYEEYKDSGLDWLPEVPVAWDVARIKYRAHLVTDRADEKTNPVALEHIEGWTGRLVESAAEFMADGIRFRACDVLFGKLRPYLAKSWMADRSGEAVGDFHVMRPASNIHPRFLNYVTLSREFISMVNGSTFGSKMPRASWDFIGNIRYPFPDEQTQCRIAEYLDRETSQIDELIGKQEQLIELLAEKRQATITHAVTRGLDPTAPTKPSGIPWHGDIPTHWMEKPMCHFMTGRVDYRGATPKKTDDGIFLVTAKNVRKGYIDYEASAEYVGVDDYENVMSRGRPALGDILMTMEAPLGNFALVDDPGVALAQRVIKFRPKAELIPEFSVYAMNSPYFRAQLEERATGSTALGLKASKLIELRLVAPSVTEQQKIVDYLDLRTGRIDALTRRSETAVKLLSERRSALISAAVTGKIDTRKGAA